MTTLLEGTPEGIDVDGIRAALEDIEGVVSVHDLHVWGLTPQDPLLSLHLVVRDDMSHAVMLKAAYARLHERFGISHATLQVEGEACLTGGGAGHVDHAPLSGVVFVCAMIRINAKPKTFIGQRGWGTAECAASISHVTRCRSRHVTKGCTMSTREHPLGVSFEFFPPSTEAGREKLKGVRDTLAERRPRFFSVTYGAGGSTQARTFETVQTVRQSGIDTAPHLSCIGSDKGELRERLASFREAGIDSLVALRGDAFRHGGDGRAALCQRAGRVHPRGNR